MFSTLSIEEKRGIVLHLQNERKELKVKSRSSKVSKAAKKPRQKKPVFDNPEIQKIFSSMPAEFQRYIQDKK